MSQFNDSRFTNLESEDLHVQSFIALQTISEGNVVTLGTGNNNTTLGVSVTSATTDVVCGVAKDNAVTNSAVPIQLPSGAVAKVKIDTGETINYGDYVGPSSTTAGRVRKVTPSATAQQILGQSIGKDGSVAGDVIPVVLVGGQVNS